MAEPRPPVGVPADVAAMARAIASAALACQLAELADLTAPGFNGHRERAASALRRWRSAEEDGNAPLGTLVRVLALPQGRIETSGWYVWPSAYAAEGWDDVADAQREQIRDAFGDGVVAAQVASRGSDEGAYVGPWLAIDEAGQWVAFRPGTGT